MNLINILEITELEGGTYTVETITDFINTVTNWAIGIGISLAGLVLVIGFITLAVVDVEQKNRAKSRITQTIVGIVGIIVSISIVNVLIRHFIR